MPKGVSAGRETWRQLEGRECSHRDAYEQHLYTFVKTQSAVALGKEVPAGGGVFGGVPEGKQHVGGALEDTALAAGSHVSVAVSIIFPFISKLSVGKWQPW